MEINSFFEKLDLKKPADCFYNTFLDAQKEYSESGVFFLEDDFIEEVNSVCGCFPDFCNQLKEAAALARKNSDIALYALFVYKAMLDRENFKKHLAEFTFPVGSTKDYDFLPLLIMLPSIPGLYNNLKAHNIPEDIIKATLRQYELCIYLFEERFDRPGFDKRYFDHMQLYVDAQVLNIDRLRFQMIESLENPIIVLENNEKELAVLFNGENINSHGMIKGTPPAEKNNNCFYAEVKETDSCFIGYRVTDAGVVSISPESFPKDQWKVVLKQGDKVISVHIPKNGALTKEACEASYQRARQVFKDCYPDFNYKAFHCHTWMFDPQLKEFLSPNSNILMFRKKYTLFPGKTEGTDVFNFVFKLKFKEYKDMPEDTSLQRAIKHHYLDGKYIYEFEGIFL